MTTKDDIIGIEKPPSGDDAKACIVGNLGLHARNRPAHPAIEDGQRIISYGELDHLVGQAAANLRNKGVQVGDFVALMLGNSADHVIILCALARLGAVICSISPLQSRREVSDTLNFINASALIAPASIKPFSGVRMLADTDVLRPGGEAIYENASFGNSPILLQQSSGATGRPKNALHDHQEFLHRFKRSAKMKKLTAAERFLCMAEMTFPLTRTNCFEMLYLGATIIVNHTRTAGELVAFANERRISYLPLTPSRLIPLLTIAKKGEVLFPNLAAMVVSTSPTSSEQRQLARQYLTPNFFETLGSNETGILAQAEPEDQDAYPSSLGRIADGIEAQIVDDTGAVLPTGETGLVGYRGLGISTGYLNNPEANAKAFRDGWFYPGDLATLNEEGYLFFKGRADDVINHGGAKFYPIEIEAVLLAHPAVREAAVFGWPHQRYNEVVAACFVANKDVSLAELNKFCALRLSASKVPQIILKVEEMPKNSVGKILKNELKQVVKENLTSKRK
jgi:acyl-coenzyme A synthetase/AMP-(fatty) acid ligase